MNSESFVYFIFSSNQYNLRMKTEKKIGRKYSPGTVLVNGSYKLFTDIVEKVDHSRYPDAKIVASGQLNKMIYKRR